MADVENFFKALEKNEPSNELEVISKLNLENETLQKTVEAQKQEISKLDSAWKRSVADHQNYKKRAEKDLKENNVKSKLDFIVKLLSVKDGFDLATSSLDPNNDWGKGVLLVATQLENLLKSENVVEVDYNRYDPNLHEAISTRPEIVSGDFGVVIDQVVLKGYKFGDKLLRPAKVTTISYVPETEE